MYFSKRLLMYETKSSKNDKLDYGEVSQVITDKLINVNMGGSNYTLEAVSVASGYIPKVGDWVVISWQNGNPVAKGSNETSNGYGLNDINIPVVVAQNDLASGTINSDHIRSESIEARHMQVGSVTADAISANTITSDKIASNTITGDNISANTITGTNIASNTITSDNIKAGSISATSMSANSIGAVNIQANAIQSYHISANQVQTQHISANSVQANQIGANQVNATHISANSISSQAIQANAVQVQHISANSVQANQISSNAVQTRHISANTINAGMIQANAITSNAISANTINAGHMQANSVTATAISSNAVQTQHISANTITTSQIKAGAITTSLISANSITTNLIQAGAITTALITANAITSNLITANAIQTQHISSNTIISSQIQANAIISNLISANAVQTQHISANSIISSQIQTGAITSNLITANAIQTQHISSNTINGGMIQANTISGGNIMSSTITAQNIQANAITASAISANSINTNHIQAGAITSNLITANAIQSYHISANQVQTQHISANSITGGQIQANTITSVNIQAGSILGTDIASNTITSVNITGNAITSYHISANAVQTQHISANSIMSNQIGANQVNATHISANSITTPAISANSITTDKIQANAIQAQNISANAVQTQHISANTITAGMMQANSVTSSTISANTIYTAHIQAGAVTSALISANAVQTQHISANTVMTSQIQAGAITTALISANSINAGLIQANAIQTYHITANAITSNLISANAVQTQHISANSITTAHIQAGAITTSLISANTITSALIQSDAIQTQHISSNSITTSKIQAGAITSSLISANAVQTQHISANTITTSQIQAGAITSALITANAIQSQHISSNTITGAMIQGATISGGNIMASTITGANIQASTITTNLIQAGAITTSLISANSIVSSLIQANAIQSYHISANQVQTQHISANTITTAQIQAGAITTALITANAITSTLIQANAVQTVHITANAITTNQISANAVTTAQISSNAIQTRHISANTITTGMIQAGAITTNLITANAITTNLIGANQIMGFQISANQISGNHIVANSISTQHIMSNSIDTAQIQAGAITTALITANAITSNLISANAVQTQHISANSVTSSQISANAVQTQHISANTITTNQIQANAVQANNISANSIQAQHISANNVETQHISSNSIQTRHISANTIVGNQIQANQISANHIVANSITAQQMAVNTITASSGILATGSILTANIASGNITSALIGVGEVKTANIASGNITNALIANATIDHSKILSVDAGTITVGQLNGAIIQAGTISGNQIAAQSITADRLKTGTIDTVYIKAGAIVTDTISSGAVTTDKIEAGAITGDLIRAGSITAEHISTVGLDAQLIQVYNSQTGETLVGSGYLRVDGLDVGVVQSDNLMQNGLFLASSSDYGYKRMNPSGEALLGNTVTGVGSHQVWKIDLTSGNVVKTIDVPAKKPFDIAIHPTGNYAYITVQGDNTLIQLDITQDTLTQSKLNMGMGPSRAKFVGEILEDHKHVFVLNTDPDDMHIPDSLMVIDTPPSSVNGDLYLHHEIVLGNNPYDFIVDSGMFTYITMASQGDIVMVDSSGHDSHLWKIKSRIPISAFGTDNNHADLPSTVGLQEVTGGDASGQYNNSSMGTMTGMGGMDAPNGYGSSDGSLRTYTPHGIAQSSDANTLYVADYANGELVVVDKYGNAPYNALIGTTAQGSYQMSNVTSSSSPASLGASEAMGGGPGTYYVRYRIPVGDSPDFVQVVNGKIFVSLQGSGEIAVIDESEIINEINADNSYYGTKNADGTYPNWNVFQPMRTVNMFTVRTISNVGNDPSVMKAIGNNLYVSLSGQGQLAVIDTIGEKVTNLINVGTNPKGFDFTPDGKYLYVANYGGIGDLSFIYPQGVYIGDPFMALEGGIMYQGADGWTPDRSDWVFDASGNIQSKSTVEFHINEPLKNEGGYAKLTAYGIDPQYAQIEQDIVNVENYSNGNNTVVVTGGRLMNNYDMTVWTPREGSFISGTVHNVMIGTVVSGNNVLTSANSYTVNYSLNQVIFSANAVGSGNWVQADYTAPNNIYFKTHNSSVEIAVDNGSSPNFATSFQVDEFVPNFVAVDNRQTSSFTPTADGISDTYEGLEYSVMTNRSPNSIGSSSQAMGSSVDTGSTTFDYSLITSGYEPDQLTGNTTGNATPTSSGNISLSGNSWVELDLQDVYMVGKISVSHMYGADRVYHNTKTQVSEDGTNWVTVFDSATSGEYNEKPYYDNMNSVTNYSHFITFGALPVRYIRDYANGWTSGDGKTSGNTSDWTQINVYGDWKVEKGYTYPSNSTKSGQQIATNGIGFVSTDISKAYIAMNVQINFTSWWWMTYIVGPDFGRIKIEMPTLMNSGHFLNQQAPFVNNVAHRHIMSFPPSMMVQGDSMNGIEAGKHRVIIRQDSGKVTLDRLRFDDYQMYQRSTLAIPSQSSPATFTRYKVIAEQAKWYQGQGRQSTEGAYDTPRTNPDTGNPDYSVPIKYRVRVLSQLSPTGAVQERGTVYVTSAIFETGKQSTHWRRSEASDVFAGNKIETWNPSQPMNTGIQSAHLADGAVRSSKILPNAVYDYHISNYARIQEHKLELNYPTHTHTNKSVLDSIIDWAGTSGNFGTGNTMARGDHRHDDRYLQIGSGGTVTGNTTFDNGINSYKESHFSNGTYSDPAVNSPYALKVSQGIATDKLNVSGPVTVTGNITLTGSITLSGTVDSVDVSSLNASYGQTSANVTNHIGSGGSAHALVTSGSAGFMSSSDKIKLDAIQSSSINQTTADARYAQISGGNLNNTTLGKMIEHGGDSLILGNNDWTPLIYYNIGGIPSYNANNKGVTFSGGSNWVKVRTRLPIDPESTYFVRAKVTKNSGSGTAYIGADTLDSNYNSLQTDTAQSYNYFGASGVTIASGTSQYFEGTISGYNATNTGSPNKFDPSGNYFDLVLIANYNGSGATTFEWIELYKAPNTGYIGSSLIATQPWVTGNYYTQSYLNSILVDATESTHGFLSTSDKTKLDGIQSSSINQATTDGRYVQLSGSTMVGDLTLNGQLVINQYNAGIQYKLGAFNNSVSGSQWWHGPNGSGDNVLQIIKGGSGNSNYSWYINGSDLIWTQRTLGTDPATQTWVSGNFYNKTYIDGQLVDATETTHGFLSTSDKTKLDGIQSGAINQTTADARYQQLSQGLNMSGNKISFDVNTQSGNSGVASTDYGYIYGEHDSNSENSRLVIEIGDNTNDSVVIRTHNLTTVKDSFTVNYNGISFNDVPTVSGNGTLATQPWVTGNYYTQSYIDGVLVDATESQHGFLSTSDKTKLDGIQSSAINQTTTDGRYLQLTGGVLSGGLTVTGNISVTGTVDGVDVSGLNSSYGQTSANVTNHIGSGGSAHPVAISGGSAGFIDGTNYAKLLNIQSNAINQATSDSRYLQLTGGTLTGDLKASGRMYVLNGASDANGGIEIGRTDGTASTPYIDFHTGSGNDYDVRLIANGGLLSGNAKGSLDVVGNLTINSNQVWHKGNLADPATQTWISGNYYNTSTIDSKLVDATETVHGFMSTSDKTKLDGIQSNAINQTTTDGRYLQLTGGALTGNLKTTGRFQQDGGGSNTLTEYYSGSTRLGYVGWLQTGNHSSNPSITLLFDSFNGIEFSDGGTLFYNGNQVWHQGNISDPATKTWISGNYYNTSTIDGKLVDATETTHGFMSTSDKTKLDGIQSSAINQATADGRYLNISGGALSGNLSVTGNITITGTVDGVDVSALNNSYSVTSGNVTNHIGSGGSAHAVAISGGANGFIDGANYGKLLRIQDNAINQTTADGRYYIRNQSVAVSTDNVMIGADTGAQRMGIYKKAGYSPAMAVASGNSFNVYEMNTNDLSQNISGTALMNQLMNMSSSNFAYMGHAIWHSGNIADPATKTWISGNYYNQGTVDSKVASRGDVFQANANTFTNTNTFNNAGLGIKVQPSGSVANTTKLLQVNDTNTNELFSVNYSGGVYVAGDLTVTGQTKYAGTTHVDGDYYISGNLYVSGNSTLGNASTDTTTVNGTLVVNGNIQEVGYYQEVHRRTLFGIAGDLQFQTNDTTLDTVVYNYDPSIYANPSVQTGATRYYRLYMIYSDDINSTQASGGQQSTIMYSSNAGTISWNPPLTWGDPNARRDWYTPYFTNLPTGHSYILAGLAQSGNNLGIRYVELIAYDKF